MRDICTMVFVCFITHYLMCADQWLTSADHALGHAIITCLRLPDSNRCALSMLGQT